MKRYPVLFIGHGSPMNVIENNAWTQAVSAYGKKLFEEAPPRAIVVVSAHWVTEGVKVHSSRQPKTIHDFRGFPPALHQIQYPAPSDSSLAEHIAHLIQGTAPPGGGGASVEVTSDWGFDHGTWGILHFLRPEADIPVIPVSLNVHYKSQDFYEMGRKLKQLRDDNILILGSGNIVHNLREIDFRNEDSTFDWAERFDKNIKTNIEAGDVKALLELPEKQAQEFRHAHPTSEHWAPLIVTIGAAGDVSNSEWLYEGIQNGSISMRSVGFN